MKATGVAGLVLLLACCALLPLLLAGGTGVVTGALLGNPLIVALGLLLLAVAALAVWFRGSIFRARPGGKARFFRAAAITALLALTSIVLLVVDSRVFHRSSSLEATAVEGVGVALGDLAPSFHLTDVYGRLITRTSLVAEKPGLMFFTTTYCLPCIRGLQELTRFQRDVGSDRFNVLIVFVDPQESHAALRAYQEGNGLPRTWHYAVDTDEMVVKYSLRFLDTKYVLDRRGVVRFADVHLATYETWRKALAVVGIGL